MSSAENYINILSWNINGLKTKLKKHNKRLFEIFDEYDVVLLQETKIGKPKQGSQENDDDDWETITPKLADKGYACENLEDLEFNEDEEQRTRQKTMYMTYFSSNRKGVAILINKPHILLSADCEGGDYAWVHVEIDNQRYTFVSVYCCGHDTRLNSDLMFKIVSFLTDGSHAFKSRLVIGGDFNTTLNPVLDATKEIEGHAAWRARLKSFMSIAKLSDVWRRKHSLQREYTRHHYNRTKSRLDYIFMLENDVNCVRHCNIRKDIALSDHFPVSLTLNINTTNTNDRHLALNIQPHREE